MVIWLCGMRGWNEGWQLGVLAIHRIKILFPEVERAEGRTSLEKGDQSSIWTCEYGAVTSENWCQGDRHRRLAFLAVSELKLSIWESSIQMMSRAKRPDEIPQERVEIEKKKKMSWVLRSSKTFKSGGEGWATRKCCWKDANIIWRLPWVMTKLEVQESDKLGDALREAR